MSETIDAAIDAINNLGPSQKFDVLYFSGGHASAIGSDQLVPATNGNKQAAIDSLNAVTTTSTGTNYEEGLTGASLFTPQPHQIIFLSDGEPTAGNHNDILAEFASRGIPINTIALDVTGNALALLQNISEVSGGQNILVQ